MKVGLVDLDGHNFPNLALMKLSSYHKSKGDAVVMAHPSTHYDILYVAKVFGSEYTPDVTLNYSADRVVLGGTGFHIHTVNGREVYKGELANNLSPQVEHAHPDYSLYPELTEHTAYGFLTRGCPNNCAFCIVSAKEGCMSKQVADLSEWYDGQRDIKLLDPNLLACKERERLIEQLSDSKARVDFTQGLDARLITTDVAKQLSHVNTKTWHFAFDFMKNEKAILRGLRTFSEVVKPNPRNAGVYILTNFDTTIDEDLYRIKMIKAMELTPYLMIYRKASLPKRHILRDLQRWCNNRFLHRSCGNFWDYAPRVDRKDMRETYPEIFRQTEFKEV